VANRFWVGGSGNWDGAATAHWSATTGGASGASAPTNADNVFLDANSTGVVTIVAGATFQTLDCTGFTGTLTGSANITVNLAGGGGFILNSSMTYSYTGSMAITLTSGTPNITSAGKTIAGMSIDGAATGRVLNPTDDLTMSGALTFINAAGLDLSNHNVTCVSFSQSGTGILTLTSGKTLTCTGASGFTRTSSGTLTATGSTIKLTAGTVTFAGGGGAYGNFWQDGTAAGTLTVTGANTFADFKIEAPAGTRTVKFPASTTNTITSLTVTGFTPYNRLILTSSSGAAADVLSDTAGTNSVDSADISWCTASGGATWIATNSVDSGNNSGWTFSSTVDGFLMENF
jgi:hypothetical protein